MSRGSADICFGVAFDEDYEFPWTDTEDRDIEAWWYKTSGFKASFEPWDGNGDKAPGYTEEKASTYFKERREWMAAHPLPVELVDYNWIDSNMYVLAVRHSRKTSCEGSVESLLPLPVVTSDRLKEYFEFCADHQIVLPGEPRWLLTSRWS